MIPFHPYDPAAVIARPPAPTPTIKRSPDCSACICTTTGRCCCPRGIEAILSRQSRAWALYRGRSRERCRRARGQTDRARQRQGLSGGPSSFPGTCKCSPKMTYIYRYAYRRNYILLLEKIIFIIYSRRYLFWKITVLGHIRRILLFMIYSIKGIKLTLWPTYCCRNWIRPVFCRCAKLH